MSNFICFVFKTSTCYVKHVTRFYTLETEKESPNKFRVAYELRDLYPEHDSLTFFDIVVVSYALKSILTVLSSE